MKICVISAFPPSKDNINAPTALPYQILKYAPGQAQINLYYYPGPAEFQKIVDNDLNQLKLDNIVKIPFPNFFMRYFFYVRAKLRNYPRGVGRFPENKTLIHDINRLNPDIVWLYPHWLIDWIPLLKCQNIVVTGPDSASLHSERVIRYGRWDSCISIFFEFLQYKRNITLEKSLGLSSVKVHFVGREDLKKYFSLIKKKTGGFFILHPLHGYCPIKETINSKSGKIRIIISGGGKTVYVGDHLSRLINNLIDLHEKLSPYYEFCFIGDGYDNYIPPLKYVGYSIIQKKRVENYSEELSNAQIQIFPIAVGTGTKGKVLHALSTGLLGIGSTFSYENIEVIPGEDCVIYHEPEDIVQSLEDILVNKSLYEKIAEQGAIKTRTNHASEKVCHMFWEEVLKKQ